MVSNNLPAMNEFYQDLLGFEPVKGLEFVPIDGYSDVDGETVTNPVAMLDTSGPGGGANETDTQIHVALRDPYLHHRYNKRENPVLAGHIAFRCDDIEVVKRSLDEKGIPYSDYGVWAVDGWYQIFVLDPAGTLVEIHQANYEEPGK
jgi:catechol 2,3-dioxygenase-like lactoylglutathione lyase family enzyme